MVTFKDVMFTNEIVYILTSKSPWKSLVQFTGIVTVNREIYIDILCCLRDVDRRKCPQKWRTDSWFILHNNASAHWSVLVRIS